MAKQKDVYTSTRTPHGTLLVGQTRWPSPGNSRRKATTGTRALHQVPRVRRPANLSNKKIRFIKSPYEGKNSQIDNDLVPEHLKE